MNDYWTSSSYKQGLPRKDVFQLGYSMLSKQRRISSPSLSQQGETRFWLQQCHSLRWQVSITVYDCRLQDGKIYASQIPGCILQFSPEEKKKFPCETRNTHFGYHVLISLLWNYFCVAPIALGQHQQSPKPALSFLNHDLFYWFESFVKESREHLASSNQCDCARPHNPVQRQKVN